MQILLRNASTGLFYSGPGEWTGEWRDAVQFTDVADAYDRGSGTGLDGLQVVIRYDDPEYEIPLEIAGRGVDLKTGRSGERG